MKLLLAICFAALLIGSALSWRCPANQTYVQCLPCDTFCCEEPRVCPKVCRAGDFCQCNEGFVRESHSSTRCILESDCSCYVPYHCGC